MAGWTRRDPGLACRMPFRLSEVIMNKRIVLVADLDAEWASIVRGLESSGIETDVLAPATAPSDVIACAARSEAAVIVDVQAEPAGSLALIRACTTAAGAGPVIAVATNPSLDLTRDIRLTGCFYLALHPVAIDEISSVAESAFASLGRRRATAAARRAARRILVIDDDEDFVASTTALLRSQGYTVASERTGRDGLRRAEAEPPDLIVVDVMMEHDSSGYEVNQSAKFSPEHERLHDIPILMVSSIDTDPATRFARSEEAPLVIPNAYLTKPLDIPRFLEEVSSLIGDRVDAPVRLMA
ncbi:MAG TPA: response regulator [Minicystis sp.]|nr:response regulator [Minicystis sp.]